MFIYRTTKRKELIRLKRGFYVSGKYLDNLKITGDFASYLEFLANNLIKPSYLTSAYVLSKHELLTEAVNSITSYCYARGTYITNALGNFKYTNISSDCLGKFEIIKKGHFLIKQAEKIQALVDYLYMAKKHMSIITVDSVEELRINIHLLTQTELDRFFFLVEETKSTKLRKIANILGELYVTQRN